MTWLLKLYPREWRRRYGAEIEEVVASHPKTMQLVVDLLGGAVDARLKPQAFARRLEEPAANEHPRGGPDMVNRLKGLQGLEGCGGVATCMTARDTWVSSGLAILTGLGVAAILMLNRSQLTEAIVLSMFPAALVAPTQWIYMRGHSWLAKVVLIGGPFLVCFLIGLVAGLAVSD